MSLMRFVITPQQSAPKGIECRICRRRALPGQHIFWEYDKVVNRVFHKDCILGAIDDGPQEVGRRTTKEKQFKALQEKSCELEGDVLALFT